MFKRFSCVALSVILFFGILPKQVVAADSSHKTLDGSAVLVETSATEEVQKPEGPFLFVNNEIVENADLIYHNDIAYVSLRSACLALRSDVMLTWANKKAIISAVDLHVTVDPKLNYIVANERYLYIPEGVLYEAGCIYVPARTLAKIFDAKFIHDTKTQNIYLTSGSGAILSGDEFYNTEDFYWLSHIINAESGNQPLAGKIAVGNVILNRVSDPIFPDSVYGVVFQKNQFTPTKNGTINLTPNEESILAAKLCLDGAVLLPTALFFNHVKSNSWAAKYKSYVATIGSHSFYA